MKKFLAMLLALCMVFALCACGAKEEAPAAAPAAPAAPAEEAAPEKVEVSMVAAQYGTQTADWWADFVVKFEEANPDIDFVVDVVSRFVSPAYNLVCRHKQTLSLFAAQHSFSNYANFVPVISIRNFLPLPCHSRQANNRIIFRLPHDFRHSVMRIGKQRTSTVDRRKLRSIPTKKTFHVEA